MKRLLILICSVIIMSDIFISCTTNKNNNSRNNNVKFKELYSQAIGFSGNYEKLSPIQQDTVLMLTNEDFQRFKDKYFTPKDISLVSPDKNKAVLYLQLNYSSSPYDVKSINLKNDTLTINFKKSVGVKISVDEYNGSNANGDWKWVKFLEVDKTNLKDNMKIDINE